MTNDLPRGTTTRGGAKLMWLVPGFMSAFSIAAADNLRPYAGATYSGCGHRSRITEWTKTKTNQLQRNCRFTPVIDMR